jgi:hypothetical protein
MGCGLAGRLLVFETVLGGLLEAADVALNSGGEAPSFVAKLRTDAASQEHCGQNLWSMRLFRSSAIVAG